MTDSVFPFNKVRKAVIYSPYVAQVPHGEKTIYGSVQCYVSPDGEDEDYFWLECQFFHAEVDAPRGWKVLVVHEDHRVSETYHFTTSKWSKEAIVQAVSQFLWAPAEWEV